MSIKSKIRLFFPEWVFGLYHAFWALAGNCIYNWPSRQLIIIGVTGTKGKSTVAAMICHSLNKLGLKCGMISTATIKIGEREWLNNLKMTMPGRLTLQKYLRQMVRAGCKYAVVETSSEGIRQWRHIGINYDIAIFTNLTPEHIESHGSFERYRSAKLKLWKKLQRSPKWLVVNQTKKFIPKVSIVNGDDPEYDKFIFYPADKKFIYSIKEKKFDTGIIHLRAEQVKTEQRSIEFFINNVKFELPIGGKFNVANTLAALTFLVSQEVDLDQAANALKTFTGAPGRLEFIEAGQAFQVVVDYAHTAESLEAIYETLIRSLEHKSTSQLIAVLGSCGGGRDKDKRVKLGALAAKYADLVIVTNEDPYDEDPQSIMQAVANGAKAMGKQEEKNLWLIIDRRQAIAKALKLAKAGDTVIVTGKGSEQWLVTKNSKLSWDDRMVIREELNKLNHNV
ncbi:MAG: UDP-N-acetylmuramoyl-L-alanyl-D-glutamate--2,6-diaminopimelate ligase [Patescibacteria group bacterium]